MRRRGIGARRQQRHDRRIVAADALNAARAGIVDFGDQIAFAHADLDFVDDALMHGLDDAGSVAHVVDLGRALHGALPVDQRGGVNEPSIGQVLLQRGEGGGGEPVIVHLDADGELVPAALCQHAGEIIHRVSFGRLHIVVGIAHDVVVGEIGGALGAVGVLAASIPDRLARRRHDDRLMHIEGPAVIAGQPGHVGGIADDQQIDPLGLHGFPRLGEAIGKFASREFQVWMHRSWSSFVGPGACFNFVESGSSFISCLSVIFSENRFPLFRITLWPGISFRKWFRPSPPARGRGLKWRSPCPARRCP